MADQNTPKPDNVRAATAADENAVYDLFLKAHQDNGVLAISEPKVRAMILDMIPEPGKLKGLIGVIDGVGELAGAVGLTILEPWYSEELVLIEKLCFVAPPYRRSGYAGDLINFAKWVSDELNLPLEMGILTTKRMPAKVRLYGRRLRCMGAVFTHGIERANGPLALEARHG